MQPVRVLMNCASFSGLLNDMSERPNEDVEAGRGDMVVGEGVLTATRLSAMVSLVKACIDGKDEW
jgi:hypothetical protein